MPVKCLGKKTTSESKHRVTWSKQPQLRSLTETRNRDTKEVVSIDVRNYCIIFVTVSV